MVEVVSVVSHDFRKRIRSHPQTGFDCWISPFTINWMIFKRVS